MRSCHIGSNHVKLKTVTRLIIAPCFREQDNFKGERINGGFCYLHGDVETEVGFDCIDFVGLPQEYTITRPCVSTHGTRVTAYHGDETYPHLNGIFPIKVIGIRRACIGFFWTEYDGEFMFNGKEYIRLRQRGYVLFRDDECLPAIQSKYDKARAAQREWDIDPEYED